MRPVVEYVVIAVGGAWLRTDRGEQIACGPVTAAAELYGELVLAGVPMRWRPDAGDGVPADRFALALVAGDGGRLGVAALADDQGDQGEHQLVPLDESAADAVWRWYTAHVDAC